MSEITIKIGGDSKDLEKEVVKVKKVLSDLGGSMEAPAKTGNMAFASFVGNLASSATIAAFNGIKNLFGEIISAGVGFAKSAEEDNKALTNLNIALAQTGQYSKESAAQLATFVDSLEKSSNFSGPAIANAAAYVQQLGKLSSEALPAATQAVADFAAANQISIETASKVVGKALSGNVEALSKYGIELKSTGDKAADAQMVIERLSSSFGGAALAQTNNLSGALNQLQNQYDDVGKAIASQVTENAALKGAVAGIAVVFQELGKIIENNKAEIGDLVTNGVLFLVDGISAAGKTLGWFISLGGDISTFFNFIDEMILASIQSFYELQAGVGNVAANVKEFFGGNADSIRAFVSQAETSVQAFQQLRDANDAETASVLANTEAKTAAIMAFSTNAEQIVRDRVARSQEADQQETDSYLTQMNVRGEARAAENAMLTEEQLAKKELDALQTEEYFANLQEVLGREAALREQAKTQSLASEGKYGAALKNAKAAQSKAEQESIFATQKYEDLSQKQRLANLQSSLGQVASLQSSTSKELFMVGKAAAIASATIDGIRAVQLALASAPPPFNFAIAAAVGVATALNVAKIAKQPPPKGAVDGAYVDSGVFGKDTEPFMLSRGELVAPAKSFDEVIEGVARQRGFVKPGEGGQGQGEIQKTIIEIEMQDRASEYVSLRQREGRALGLIGAT